MMQGLVYGKQEFATITFGACASLGFILAIIGLFSVMTYIVSLKTHEVGIRLALGAPQAAILHMMLKRGFLLVAPGLVLGLLASVGLTRLLSNQFRGVSATDPFTLILVVAAVLLAGLSACFFPARRATQVDPMATLRSDG